MKRLAIIFAILITPFILRAQFPIDSVAFKAYQLDIFYGYEDSDGIWHTSNKETEIGEAILYIANGQVQTTRLKDQLSSFQFYPDLEYFNDYILSNKNIEPGYGVTALDNSFSTCQFNIIYQPDQERYLIRIDYSNMRFMFFCEVTDERPSDSDWQTHPLTPKNLIEEGNKYETNPDYTEEELIEFFNHFGNGKLILEGIKASFYAGTLEGI